MWLRMTLIGSCSLADVVLALELRAAAAAVRYQPCMLWDIRALHPTMAPSDFAAFMRRQFIPGVRPSTHVAVVTSSDLLFGFGRVVQTYIEIYHTGTELRVFRDMIASEAWLRQLPIPAV